MEKSSAVNNILRILPVRGDVNVPKPCGLLLGINESGFSVMVAASTFHVAVPESELTSWKEFSSRRAFIRSRTQSLPAVFWRM